MLPLKIGRKRLPQDPAEAFQILEERLNGKQSIEYKGYVIERDKSHFFAIDTITIGKGERPLFRVIKGHDLEKAKVEYWAEYFGSKVWFEMNLDPNLPEYVDIVNAAVSVFM